MNKKIMFLVFTVVFTMISCSTKSGQFDVADYGAIGDSLHINTLEIQKAIDDCSQNGGGIVVLKKGVYISGTIMLKDNVTLHIDEDAKLVGSSNPYDYQSIDTFIDATGQERGNCLIGGIGVSNISIVGKGSIDGNGAAFTHENISVKKKMLGIASSNKKFGANRPFLLRFVKSSNIKIRDIELRQPAAWTCHFYQSNAIEVDNVSIYSHANHNNDGIDLDSSFNAVIKNCRIDTGDDAICFKTTSPLPTYDIRVQNCALKSEWGALKFGTESMGDFYNIHISDCKIEDTRGGGIKILSVDGGNIHDIEIENITMKQVDMPIFIRLGERLRTYRDAEKQNIGSIDNISIKNIIATTRDIKTSRVSPPSGIFMTGTPNHKIGKIKLQNIDITLPGKGKISELKAVSEQIDKYPEFSFFEALPAYGLFGRHIQNIQMSDMNFSLENTDERTSIVLDDVIYSINNGVENVKKQ